MDIIVRLESTTPAPCSSGTGTITISAIGGVGVLLYEWFSDSGLTNLVATGQTLIGPYGIYYYRVSEQGLGSGAAPGIGAFSIQQTTYSNVYLSAITPPTTTGGANGTATISFNGIGVSSYPMQVIIDNVQIPNQLNDGYVTLSSFSAGPHNITVIDGYGCTTRLDFVIEDPIVPTITPLTPDLSFCDTTSTLTITDNTGAFSFSNTGGYGAPNPELDSVTGATLHIVMSNGIIYDIDVFSTQFPNNVNGSITLGPSQLPNGLVDGLAQVTLVLTGVNFGVPWRAEKVFTLYITATVACCVSKLGANITSWENCCENSAARNFVKAYNMLVNINYLAKECCFFAKADEVLKQLQLFCKSNNCTTC
jgi:hypothetical protein